MAKKSKKSVISLKRKRANFFHKLFLFFKLSFALLIVSLFFTNYWKVCFSKTIDVLSDNMASYGFVLKDVIIQGQGNASDQEIANSLDIIESGDPIFSINIREIKERLESTVWIEKAFVERRLPSKLYIEIIERKAVAIWQFKQKLYLIDSEGNRIAKYNYKGFSDLIHVVGQDANIYASSLLSDLNKYPELASKVKSAVRYGNRRWNLNLYQKDERGVLTVKMPENDFEKAYQYLHSLEKDKKLFGQGYTILDLRDSNKYYLGNK